MASSIGYEPNAQALADPAGGNAMQGQTAIYGPPTQPVPASHVAAMVVDPQQGSNSSHVMIPDGQGSEIHRVWRSPSPTKEQLKSHIDELYKAGGDLLAEKENMEEHLKNEAKAALDYQKHGFERASQEAMQHARDVSQVEVARAEMGMQNALPDESRAARAAADLSLIHISEPTRPY